jgi:hypothetical protein
MQLETLIQPIFIQQPRLNIPAPPPLLPLQYAPEYLNSQLSRSFSRTRLQSSSSSKLSSHSKEKIQSVRFVAQDDIGDPTSSG